MKRCKQSSRAMRQRTTAEVHTRGTSKYALKVKARRQFEYAVTAADTPSGKES